MNGDDINNSPRENLVIKQHLLSPTIKKTNSAGDLALVESPSLNKYHSCDANYMKESEQYKRRWVMNRMKEMNLNLNISAQIIEDYCKDWKEKELIVQEMVEYLINNSSVLHFPVEHHNIDITSETPNFLNLLKKKSQNSEIRPELVLMKIESEHVAIQISERPNPASIIVKAKPVMCEICSLDFNNESTDFMKTSQTCGYSFCKACCKAFVENLINSSQIINVPCPSASCSVKLNDNDIERLCQDAKLYDKYKKFKISLQVNLDPNARWCISPGCENILYATQSNSKLVCDKCNTAMCSKCLSRWHEKQTCEEAIEGGYAEYTKNVQVRNCRRCRTRIEKNGGCNHMTCVKCNYQFCWLCNGTYGSRHYRWWNLLGCPLSQYNKASKFEITKTFLKKTVVNFFILLFYLICFAIGIPLLVTVVTLVGVVCYLILPFNKALHMESDFNCHKPLGKVLCWIVFTIFWYAMAPCFFIPYSIFAFIRILDKRTPFSTKNYRR